MTEEILPDRHFFSVHPLLPLFNSIEISVSFNPLELTLNFVFWGSIHNNKYLHSYTNCGLYLLMHFSKAFKPVKPMFLVSKVLCECERVKEVLHQPKGAGKSLTF